MSAAQSRPGERDVPEKKAQQTSTPQKNPKMEEEIEAILTWTQPPPRWPSAINHRTYRTVELRKFTVEPPGMRLRRPTRNGASCCRSTWVGGEPVDTPWKRAHLEAVRQAVEKSAPLLELQPAAIQDLHRTLLNDPPCGNGRSGPAGVGSSIPGGGGSSLASLQEWRQNEEQAEAEKKAGLGGLPFHQPFPCRTPEELQFHTARKSQASMKTPPVEQVRPGIRRFNSIWQCGPGPPPSPMGSISLLGSPVAEARPMEP